ncbi:hypothetical protein [Rubrivirga sp. IMCC45206]|uniref:hypothetical protein n=1 Tax=Rubrivirga sp. IMCC45206 TaxID=3391614 RepID=UPI0039900486
MARFPLALAALVLVGSLAGCGMLNPFAKADLTVLEVAGRYRVVEFRIDPVSEAVRDRDLLGDVLSRDATLLLREDGTAALEVLRGERVDETISGGAYTVSGRTVTVRFADRDALGRFLLPAEIRFDGDGSQLSAEIFREGLNLEDISGDYRGITRADATLRIRLREIG